MNDFQGKVALITGARSGIGAATAQQLAERGAKVAIGVRKDGDGEETLTAVREAGGDGAIFTIDVSDQKQIDDGVAAVIDTFGRLDVLIANAGIEPTDTVPIQDWTVENIDKLLTVNLRGVLLTCRAGLPHIVKAKGSVCLLSSLMGTVGSFGVGPYSATKAGVQGITRTLAVEQQANGVRVNCVVPGAIATEMLERFSSTIGGFSAEKNVPMGRAGRAEEVAAAITWLCSPAASYVTGQSLGVDGGITVVMPAAE
ncbi:SDR family NAD(P)-dependent oxidoreductase [Pelagibius sp.]|uniref:SDR family NAD(P)-dependent oxidoreductase n=1 Tax=Pelagibius sp. TaxID=1931238 RepID=UPI003B50F29A